ncbi:PREDICTED: EF-hand calcium-binding domain-containing protein 11-like [Galeopterus variegatus]|uniref:EF-hand calcium-binding domain-containing protein 11-like n=1 Tax=Galeopterus variegatus TaxID=482537 RepID=A0ABM0S7P8_GALVR|nr:PREDICTED: EF-hand calcium-binding domain-containing protein 11-like [Galeopterus variegatus]
MEDLTFSELMLSLGVGDAGVSLEQFLDIVRKKKEAQLYQNETRRIFTAFDIRYRGFLTLEDFKKAFRQVAPKLPERTVLEVFRHLVHLPPSQSFCSIRLL